MTVVLYVSRYRLIEGQKCPYLLLALISLVFIPFRKVYLCGSLSNALRITILGYASLLFWQFYSFLVVRAGELHQINSSNPCILTILGVGCLLVNVLSTSHFT